MPAGLQEYIVRDSNLAYIMHRAGVKDGFYPLLRESEVPCQYLGVVADPLDMILPPA